MSGIYDQSNPGGFLQYLFPGSLEYLFWSWSFTYLCFLYFAPKCILYFASKCILWLNNGLLASEGICTCSVTPEWPPPIRVKIDDFFSRAILKFDGWPWPSFHHHIWIQTGVTVRKRLSWVLTSVTLTFDLWPWPFAYTSLWSLLITLESFMMIWWWELSEKGVTDGQMDGLTDGQN